MAFKTDFVVIGLGRFGLSIVKTLLQEHKSVMVLDCDLEKINRIRDKVAFAAALDATDEDALCEVGIKNAEHVIVAMGSNFENQDFIELGTDLSVIKIEVLNEKLIHKTIVDANFREKFGANIIAITRDEKTFVPSAMEILQKGDLLYIIIHNKNLTKIEAFIGKNEK